MTRLNEIEFMGHLPGCICKYCIEARMVLQAIRSIGNKNK